MSANDRQRVVRVPGLRRAKLTPAPGTEPGPETPEDEALAAKPTGAVRDGVTPTRTLKTPDAEPPGPNDERMRREVPPHY